MDPIFATFALLPLGLASLFCKTGKRDVYAGLGFLAALAPLVIKGVGALAGAISGNKKKKAAEENERQAALQAEEQRKAEWEAQQNSPELAMQRMQYKMKLGKLAGRMGGLDKVPPSIANALRAGYAQQEYKPGAAYVPKKTGASGWDYVAPAIDTLSAFNPATLKGNSSASAPTQQAPSSAGFSFSNQNKTPLNDLVFGPKKKNFLSGE